MDGKKVVLVTGASAGIGKATVRLLLKEGYIVYGAARRVEQMKDIKSQGAHILGMDLTDEHSMSDGVARIIKEQGRIDVLFNNAGYGAYGAVEDVPMEEARHQFEVNLFGLSRLTQLVLPYMRNQKSGKIINTSSAGGKIYTLLGAWYHATKHALEGYSDCLRVEVKPFGIDVVVIQPGATESEWSDVVYDHVRKTSGNTVYSKMADSLIKTLGGMGGLYSPDQIAQLVLKAVRDKQTKTRYVAGNAKPVLLLRRILTDRMFDRMIYRMFKINSAQ
ncbi:oxidoreductase [Alkalicoccobacillus porphyridii]|uniref:SDR family NAD(P)-dependent oxidoreductase n=1 Tax=Alkalicoccobacillus porphyridii TaxID=2597270 RepID=A0A553ZW06_9BACI|nr:oxidoreductase [Alkalicoccobacillus porphyridii]TSB45647.1 SDR family NAD(P)-dependent oxidoreductase [Alkalicoccobacillus porphyridii]